MPRVPQYGDQKVRPINTPTPDVVARVTPEALGAGVARGVADVANAFQEVRKQANESAVLEAERKAMDLEFQTFDAPETGYLNRKGKDAIEGYQSTLDSYDKGMSGIRDGLKNDEQKLLFDQKVAAVRRQQAQLKGARHVSQERERFDAEQIGGLADASISAVGANYNDPARVGYEIGRTKAAIVDYMGKQGFGAEDEATQKRVRGYETSAHVAVIDRFLAAKNAKGAKAYYDTVKDGIAGDKRDEIEKEMSAYVAEETAFSAVDTVFAKYRTSGDQGAAEMELIDSLKGDPDAQKIARQELTQRFQAFNMSQDRSLGQAMQFALTNRNYSYASIPREFRAGLTPQNDAKLREWLDGKIDQSRARSERPDPAAQAYANQLYYAATHDPEFKNRDLTGLLPYFDAANMTAQWRQLVDEQEKLRKGKAGGEWEMADTTLKARLATLKIEKDDPRYLQATDYVRRAIDAKRNETGRALTQKEVDDLIDQSFVKGEIQGTVWNSSAYQFEAGYTDKPFIGGVPVDDYLKIANALRAAGVEPTPDRVESEYRQFQAQAK